MRSIRLRNGECLRVRPMRPDDHVRLEAAFNQLSAESRYRRFLGTKPTLTHGETRYLVEIDGRDHVALVATPFAEPDRIIAVARFVRSASEPDSAEFSIVVGDHYQRTGLGSALFERLIEAALDLGVTRFTATVLAENVGAHRLIHAASAQPPQWQHHGVTDEVTMALLPAVRQAA